MLTNEMMIAKHFVVFSRAITSVKHESILRDLTVVTADIYCIHCRPVVRANAPRPHNHTVYSVYDMYSAAHETKTSVGIATSPSTSYI